jgi:hypothetical protein
VNRNEAYEGAVKLAIVLMWAVGFGAWTHSWAAGLFAFWTPTVLCYVKESP